MPELPEVETTRRGIEPHVSGHVFKSADVRQPKLRWPVPDDLAARLKGKKLRRVARRAKYLLLDFGDVTLVIHLGMSGSLRVHHGKLPAPGKHDHFDLHFAGDVHLRYTDPRRFGACLFAVQDGVDPLLDHLGPEPLGDDFSGRYLFERSRKRSIAVKTFIMDQKIVVGVGNIYASESLFLAGIHPEKPAGNISRARYEKLVTVIREVLARAIEQGGTTLKDFVGSDGKPGYFKQSLHVYGRAGENCDQCGAKIQELMLGQRNTFFCVRCQR
jgi:formamidopyrimidine-DNA glycosylase